MPLSPKPIWIPPFAFRQKKPREKNWESVRHTMSLEDQGLTVREDARLLAKTAKEWSENPPRWLWDA